MKLNTITIKQLLADIDITNNGYIYAPNFMQLSCAKFYPHMVSVDCGHIRRVLTVIERHHVLKQSKPANQCSVYDFEGAILSQQEKQGY